MLNLGIYLDAIAAWFKSWRSSKAGAELAAGQSAIDETDIAAAEIVAELKKKPSAPN